jgi:hypothetical protein
MVIFLLLAPLVFVIALAVRFGGDSRPLNVVDYSQISDIPSFNRWAGNRLLFLANVAIALGVIALREPARAAPLLILFMFAFLGIVYWIMIGASRFQR